MKSLYISTLVLFLMSCNNYLDEAPKGDVTPDEYFSTEQALANYAIAHYSIFPSHGKFDYGTFALDDCTDNMAGPNGSDMYIPGRWKVPQTGGNWEGWFIRECNYFFDMLDALEKQGRTISGNTTNINHYIGEMHFLRAYGYFEKLKAFGDYPIVEHALPADWATLSESSKRAPRNEVARFILKDLDQAILLLQDNIDGNKNRISKNVALLFKSRVALFEGSWLKNFKGTPFVPNGPQWPGKSKDYNADYEFPEGDIDSEANWFFQEAMEAAELVADKVAVVQMNTSGDDQEWPTQEANPYFDMFGDTDMSKYSEVLMWKKYDLSLGVVNDVAVNAGRGNYAVGTTRSMVDAFLLRNGEPIYATPPRWDDQTYWGDNNRQNVTNNRDARACIFIQKPWQQNYHTEYKGQESNSIAWIDMTTTDARYRSTTGYALRKGLNFDGRQSDINKCTVGCITFRASEAYLNYIEACYEKTGTIDAKAEYYWTELRSRAKVNTDFNFTIGKTDMTKEVLDWGAYTAGELVDATRYNIRRERRCELMAEGLRMMDLKRWRAMDQMINTPYHVEGMNVWEEMAAADWFTPFRNPDGSSKLKPGENISPASRSKYARPYEITPEDPAYDGYVWKMAHYLEPIAIQHFMNTTLDGDISKSPIYQNPCWPTSAGSSAIE